jgi:hypothetical protein
VQARFWRGVDGGAGLKVRDVRGPHVGMGEVEGEERKAVMAVTCIAER